MAALSGIFDAFHSMTKAIEVFTVMQGNRPLARIAVHESRLGDIRKFCEAGLLSLATSDFKLSLAFSGDYSTIGKPTAKEGHFLAYISKSMEIAEQGKQLESGQKHEELGRLLGYPECCSSFFARHYDEESRQHHDFVMPALSNSKGRNFAFVSNIFARYFDAGLLSHCPHSFSCERSREIAGERLRLIEDDNPGIASQLMKLLKSAAVYENGHVHLLLGARIMGNSLLFEDVISTSSNALHRRLREAGNAALGRGHFLLQGQKIRHPLLIFE